MLRTVVGCNFIATILLGVYCGGSQHFIGLDCVTVVGGVCGRSSEKYKLLAF